MKKVILPLVGVFMLGLMVGCEQSTTTRSPMGYDQTKGTTGTTGTTTTPMTDTTKKK